MNKQNKQQQNKAVSAEEFDRIFDEGKEDILDYLDLSTVRHPGLEAKRVNESPNEPSD